MSGPWGLVEPPEEQDGPIYRALYAETLEGQLEAFRTALHQAARTLAEQLRPMMARVARAMAHLGDQLLAPPPTPEQVLDRIRADQASLDNHRRWRAERGQL